MVLLDPRTWVTSQDPLRVVALRDPAVEAVGYEPRSRYVEVTGAVGISVWGECLPVEASLPWSRR